MKRAVVGLMCLVLVAAEMPPSPVRYTEARSWAVGRALRLPGTVQPRTTSLVASEVEGLVERQEAREGDTVRKGQPIVRLRTDALAIQRDATAAQLKEATSRLKLAELSLQRVQELASSQVVSQQDLDNATYETSAWQGRVETLQAQLAAIALDLERCVVRAPFAGRIVAESAKPGQWVVAGGPVVEMMSMESMEVRVEVPEKHYGGLRNGAAATVTLQALPGTSFSGTISAVVPRADPAARTFPIKVRIPGHDARLGAGMLAEVTLPADTALHTTVIPKDALVTQGTERFVYRIEHDGTAKMIPVVPGEGVGAWVAVSGEVKPGDKVITRGNERLRPGTPVRGEPLEYALP